MAGERLHPGCIPIYLDFVSAPLYKPRGRPDRLHLSRRRSGRCCQQRRGRFFSADFESSWSNLLTLPDIGRTRRRRLRRKTNRPFNDCPPYSTARTLQADKYFSLAGPPRDDSGKSPRIEILDRAQIKKDLPTQTNEHPAISQVQNLQQLRTNENKKSGNLRKLQATTTTLTPTATRISIMPYSSRCTPKQENKEKQRSLSSKFKMEARPRLRGSKIKQKAKAQEWGAKVLTDSSRYFPSFKS